MATIPTGAATVDATGLIGGAGITVNESVQSVNKNEPIFGVGSSDLKGYIALAMYEQKSASVVGAGGASGGGYDLFVGESYASGKPYVMSEATWANTIW